MPVQRPFNHVAVKAVSLSLFLGQSKILLSTKH
jgi:hypothetical protein